MEEERTSGRWLGAIIRGVIFIVIIILVAFFVVRFVQNRRASDRAEQAVSTTTEQTSEDEADSSRRDEVTEVESDGEGTPSSDDESVSAPQREDDIPTGVADVDQTPQAGPRSLPEAGIGANIGMTALLLATIASLIVRNQQYRNSPHR